VQSVLFQSAPANLKAEATHRGKGSTSSRPAPIRVLMTTPSVTMPGGVAQYLRVLQPYLGDNVKYFAIGARSGRETEMGAAWRLLEDSRNFARKLRQEDFDLVHINPSIGYKALVRDGLLLLVAKAQSKAVVVFVHGWDEACGRVVSTYFTRLFRFVYGRANAFVVLAKEFEARLRLMGLNNPVFVQTAPLADEIRRDSQEFPARHYEAKGSRTFEILFLARVEREKGIYEALDTYRILQQRHPFVSMTVAGEGRQLSEAMRYASRLGLTEVTFCGHVEGSQKCRVYRKADAYFFPSHSEGLPLSVLEAMAYGLPIVTSAVGGLRDFFRDGTMGFMSESNHPEVLAERMSQLISNPELCSRMSLCNRNYAADRFTGPRVAENLERIYSFALDGVN
jgi:glycosyltransferase involved in cell wall biosynthesis